MQTELSADQLLETRKDIIEVLQGFTGKGAYLVDLVVESSREIDLAYENNREERYESFDYVDNPTIDCKLRGYFLNGHIYEETFELDVTELDLISERNKIKVSGGYRATYYQPGEAVSCTLTIEATDLLYFLTETKMREQDIAYMTDKHPFKAIREIKDLAAYKQAALAAAQEPVSNQPITLRVYSEDTVRTKEGATKLHISRQMAYAVAYTHALTERFYYSDPQRAQAILKKTDKFGEYIQRILGANGVTDTVGVPVFFDEKPILKCPLTHIMKTNQGVPVVIVFTPFVGCVFKGTDKQPVVVYDLNTMSLEDCARHVHAFGMADYFKVCDLRSKLTTSDLLDAINGVPLGTKVTK